MKKKFVKISLWTIGIIIMLLLTFTLILYLNKDKVESLIKSEINSSLNVEVAVGKIDISLEKFPSASLVFKDIYTRGVNSNIGDTLIYAEEIFFQFNIWEALSSSITINEISIEHSTINLKYLKNGSNNFTIWKTQNESENQIFTLEKINFRDTYFSLYKEIDEFSISSYTSSSTFSGKFSDEIIQIKAQSKLAINALKFPKTELHNFSTESRFSLTHSNGVTELESGTTKIDGIEILFSGILDENGFNFNLSGNDLDIESIQDFTSSQKLVDLSDFAFSGKLDFKNVLNSKQGQKPVFNLDFSFAEGKLSNGLNLNLKDLNGQGKYNLSKGKDKLTISSFSAKGKTGDVKGSLLIENLSKPLLHTKIQSNLNLSEWTSILQLDTLSNPKGKLELDLDFKNQFRSFKNIQKEHLKNAQIAGSLSFDDAEFGFKNSSNRIESLNGELLFENEKTDVKRLFFKTGNSDLYLEGRFKNLISFILVDDQNLGINCKVKSQNLEIEDFLKGDDSSPDEYNLEMVERLNLDLRVELDQFAMKDFSASQVKGDVVINKKQILVNGLTLNSDDGTYNGSLKIKPQGQSYLLQTDLTFDQININKLFRSFEDFGQEAIVAKNIYGTLNGSGTLSAKMNQKLEIDKNSIVLKSDLLVENGGIKNYEPMMELSRFSDIEELKDVRFSSLKNSISIQNSVINIPQMQIKSNVLDLQLQGSHNFENIVDYRLKLKAEDALFKKRKTKDTPSEFDEHLIQRSKDEPYIYIKMLGPMDNLEISLDKQSIGKSISNDLKNQGKQLKNIFKKDKPNKKSDNPGIIYEWDEEDDG